MRDGWPVSALSTSATDRGANSDGLHRRLRQFRRYGEGGSARHSGGRRIWQLADHAALLVGWLVTDDDGARKTE